ncbi:hypothetical protein BCR36DRAFT_365806 [Piromyces finnis]|uniref:Uncharacterized protein n=1 Tax=Piromyces finnis TaxID=1754191 RepID=A0A1Y1VP86_9FUNG|nr:hypothetical protein BCR36DRAFT_365806 [Piromyces finnis]|eukprot:ORX61227.1 hypothetical protein BCR36DRAFT_365806 [Piromyces finnis]
MPMFIEIPDEKDNKKVYISMAHSYNDFKKYNYITFEHLRKNIYTSYKCTSDSQCLTNKCIEGVCIFNEENPTEYCTDIYINLLLRSSFMHCGKVMGDLCEKNAECASRVCNPYTKTCGHPPLGPSDSDLANGLRNFAYLEIDIFIIYFILRCFIKPIIKYIFKITFERKNKKSEFFLFISYEALLTMKFILKPLLFLDIVICLKSAVKQTLKNIEIIFVDDIITVEYARGTNKSNGYVNLKHKKHYGSIYDSIWRREFLNNHNVRFNEERWEGKDVRFRKDCYKFKPKVLKLSDQGIYYYYNM